jgi:DNA-directed RNA polymerase subunit RPC12/RpoP
MKKGPDKIDKRTFHCSECNYNVQVYSERYFDHGCMNFMETFICLDCKRLFEGITTELHDFGTISENEEKIERKHLSLREFKFNVGHIDVKSIQCLFCGSYNNIKWDPTIAQCPKCGSSMTFETQGEIRVKPLEAKKAIKEKPIKAKEQMSVEEVYKNGLFTINGIDKDNNLYPITHKGDPARIGEPMTDEELHVFGVELVLVYYHYQNGNIIRRNINPGIEYPHIVIRNKVTEKLYYVIVKGAIYPEIPEPLPTENYSTLIKLAEEAKAIPVFIGVTFTNYSADDDSPPICGGDYIVKITRLKEL